MPSGTKGAVDFDNGTIVVGTGSTMIDTFVDPMCPFCGQFEKANGAWLADQVSGGAITLRIHPMAILDASSSGSEYSSRASAALACVAADQPDKSLAFMAALFADQPQEGSTGLGDDRLAALATRAGAAGAAHCIADGEYIDWTRAITEKAVSGPIDITGSTLTAIQGTPTVVVGGALYTGSLTDPAPFQAFVAAHSTS
jgi:protein-disulfide isomerase